MGKRLRARLVARDKRQPMQLFPVPVEQLSKHKGGRSGSEFLLNSCFEATAAHFRQMLWENGMIFCERRREMMIDSNRSLNQTVGGYRMNLMVAYFHFVYSLRTVATVPSVLLPLI
jgi:hypothetical protein